MLILAVLALGFAGGDGGSRGRQESVATPPPIPALTPAQHGHRIHRIGEDLFVLGGFLQSEQVSEGLSSVRTRLGKAGWRPLPAFHSPKVFFASGVIDGAIYAVGGNIERWKPGDAAWKIASSDPRLPGSHATASVMGRSLYILGREFSCFDTKSQKLTTLPAYPSMKPADHFEVMATVGDSIHVVGGLDGESYEIRRSHWRWNGGKWHREDDAPDGVLAKTSVVEVVDGKLYVLSGMGSFRYSPKTRSWTRLAKMPILVTMGASVQVGDWIIVVGGLSDARVIPTLAYSVRADRWVVGE